MPLMVFLCQECLCINAGAASAVTGAETCTDTPASGKRLGFVACVLRVPRSRISANMDTVLRASPTWSIRLSCVCVCVFRGSLM